MDVINTVLSSVLPPIVIIIGLSIWLIFSLVRSLIWRAGRLASFPRFSFALIGLGILLLLLLTMGGDIMGRLTEYDPNANVNPAGTAVFPFLIYVFGMSIMAIVFLFRRRDIKFWFPAKVK